MNTFESVLMKCMNLECITQSEVSQKEKDKSYSNTYTWNLEEWCWRIYFQGSNRETDIENRLMDMGRGEERVNCMKSNMETYITLCKIDSQWEFAVWLRKLKQGLWINLEGWNGEGDGREFQKGGDICLPMADSCWVWQKTKFYKAIILQ